MKISEFIKAYNLHDSLLEKVEYDSEKKIVEIMIDFCYWQQTGYNDNDPETGLISVQFTNVSAFYFIPYEINSDEIIKSDLIANDQIKLEMYNDKTDSYHTLTLTASEVLVLNM